MRRVGIAVCPGPMPGRLSYRRIAGINLRLFAIQPSGGPEFCQPDLKSSPLLRNLHRSVGRAEIHTYTPISGTGTADAERPNGGRVNDQDAHLCLNEFTPERGQSGRIFTGPRTIEPATPWSGPWDVGNPEPKDT